MRPSIDGVLASVPNAGSQRWNLFFCLTLKVRWLEWVINDFNCAVQIKPATLSGLIPWTRWQARRYFKTGIIPGTVNDIEGNLYSSRQSTIDTRGVNCANSCGNALIWGQRWLTIKQSTKPCKPCNYSDNAIISYTFALSAFEMTDGWCSSSEDTDSVPDASSLCSVMPVEAKGPPCW